MRTQQRKTGLIVCIFIILMLSGCAKESASPSLCVGIPHSDNVQNLESNYYINWLEDQTGIDIIPVEIRQTRCDEYLESLFSSDTTIDMVLFGNKFVPSKQCMEKLEEGGYLHQLSDGTYAAMNYGTSKAESCGQVMWINSEWLKELSLEIPRTTEELRDVLWAFKNRDPNRNGKRDEIPLVGSMESYSLNPVFFLLNSYIYCDPYHTMHCMDNGNQLFVPETDAFMDGIEYCRELYEEELLDDRCFSYSARQLSEIVNNSDSLIGAFTSDSIGEVIYQGNPEIMAKYISVLPMEGPKGVRNALYLKKDGSVGAIIANGTGKEALCETLLDKMMTAEASLIARYGEPGVDWDYSDGLDVSIYGETATIITQKYIWNIPQNKHLNGIGPMHVPNEYLEGVTWNGINSDLEYIDARAEMNYRTFYPEEISDYEYDEKIVRCLEILLKKMIKGEIEIDEDVLSWDHLYTACYPDTCVDGM